eukprot:TRINITY_DN65940_c0_g1_i1.p1 TRINITY_DN65940_c0_g1~~TRINITY_DN65940_c0_g1_i1.p1  ORF type:complete len:387 (+),score=42.29 TRINITY_DN65940_c0_g1_i1:55-1215(+)
MPSSPSRRRLVIQQGIAAVSIAISALMLAASNGFACRGHHSILHQLRRRHSVAVQRQAAAGLETVRSETAHVLAIGTEYRQESVIMSKCAKVLGYTYQLVGFREPWKGWVTKLVQYERALRERIDQKTIAPRDPVLLVDGWDCALVGPATEFREKMASTTYAQRPIWYGGERIIGPDFFLANRIDNIYPDPGTPWKYPNAGTMAGRAEDCLGFLRELLDRFPEGGNDQEQLHLYLLELGESGQELPAWVDSRCGIFQCLYEAEPQWDVEDVDTSTPRLRNRLTGERPILLHGNGHTGRWFMSGLWREMRFLERIGLSHADLAHLPHDSPVAPGLVADEATKRNWDSTFQLYKIIEMQLQYARIGVKWDPWQGQMGDTPPDPRGKPS